MLIDINGGVPLHERVVLPVEEVRTRRLSIHNLDEAAEELQIPLLDVHVALVAASVHVGGEGPAIVE